MVYSKQFKGSNDMDFVVDDKVVEAVEALSQVDTTSGGNQQHQGLI
jgi:hypothetical protein